MNIDAIQGNLFEVFKDFFEGENYLLKNNLNERTISHTLGCYLAIKFDAWDVDCEYNRNHDDIKRLDFTVEQVQSNDTTGKTVFPDIIVHKCSTDDNLLVIEIKKNSSNSDREKDLFKIGKFIEQLGYRYGLFIDFRTGDSWGIHELVWVRNGRSVSKVLPDTGEQLSDVTLNQLLLNRAELEAMA